MNSVYLCRWMTHWICLSVCECVSVLCQRSCFCVNMLRKKSKTKALLLHAHRMREKLRKEKKSEEWTNYIKSIIAYLCIATGVKWWPKSDAFAFTLTFALQCFSCYYCWCALLASPFTAFLFFFLFTCINVHTKRVDKTKRMGIQ